MMIVIGFGLAFIRSLFFLLSYSTSSGTSSDLFYIGQVISLPVLAFTFSGVYFLYREFKEQLERRQVELVAPDAEGAT
jgi:hypothetical protein